MHAFPALETAPSLEPYPALEALPSLATPAGAERSTLSPLGLESSAFVFPALEDEESLHSSRFTFKGGYYGADEDALDDGLIFNASWMRFFTRLFALEFEVGYMDLEGDDSGVDGEAWAVPVMVNGRFNLPVWVLDLYAGVGVGGFYYDVEASGVVSAEEDGFLWGGNGFAGGTVNLADAISLGLEAKYYLTDDISDFGDASLDGLAVMLTLGWSR